MILSPLYELCIFLVFIAMLPKAIYQAIAQKKYRKSFFLRLGFFFPQVTRKENGPIVWVHAVSVGETQAIMSLVKRMKEEMKNATFVISSVTETGHATAKRLMPFADHFVFLPFDFYLCVRHVLSKCTPDVVVFSETDIWWRFLKSAKKKGAVSLVTSGKISEKSYKAFKRLQPLSKRLFSLVDFFCVQSETDLLRLNDLGVSKSKMKVTGNVKFDIQFTSLSQDEKNALRTQFQIDEKDFIVVAGSTHAPEEELILTAFQNELMSNPHFKLVLVPRHPERFHEVITLVERYGISYARWTKKDEVKKSPQIIIVDAMGELLKWYQIASCALVAGSFTEKVGGHNILEPAYFGIPTLCGPSMHSQAQLLDIAKQHHAVEQVQSPSDLYRAVKECMDNKEKRELLGKSGQEMVISLRGATHKSLLTLQNLTPQFFSSSCCNIS